jgi:Holliday junction resolvasome RuvABC endonuclease subunit
LAKIKIDDVRKAAIEHNWILISEEYKNLDSTLEFKCEEGHQVFLPYKKVRDKWECPICIKNQYTFFDEKIIPKKKNIQRSIGLDQATHITGYSIFDDGELVYAGMFEATAEDEIERDIEIKNWLIQLIVNWKPDIIGIEGIQLQEINNKYVGVTTYQTLALLQGILMATCVEEHMDYVICPQATWRSHCGVKGRTRADKKRSMQMKVKEWFDISVSDDVADAIGIGKYINDKHKKKVEICNLEE